MDNWQIKDLIAELLAVNRKITIGYARESTRKKEQDDAYDWQAHRLKDSGCELVFGDRASGGRADRHGYLQAMELVRSGVVAEFKICAVKRLGRSSRQISEAIELFRKQNVLLTSLDGSTDLKTPIGRALVGVQGVLAELDRELIRERVSDGIERKRIRREAIHVPFGYKIEDRKPVIDREAEPVIRWLWSEVIENGLIKACQAVNQNYSHLPKIPKSPGGIKSLFESEILYGNLLYGRHKPLHEQTFIPNTHAPIFTPEERAKFFESLKYRHRHEGFKSDPVRFPWSGLIACSVCGASMQVSYHTDRVFSPKKVWYRCYNGTRKSCPNNGYTSVQKIETAVFAALTERAEVIAIRATQSEAIEVDPRIVELREDLRLLESRKQTAYITTAIEGIKAEIAQIEIEKSAVEVGSNSAERLELLKACSNPAFWENVLPEDRKSIYREMVDKVLCSYREVDSVRLRV